MILVESNKLSYFLFFAIAILTLVLLPSRHKFDDLDNANVTKISSIRKLVMLDGLDDSILVDYYDEDIQFVYEFTESKHIQIDYFDVDLNSDGLKDKIVILKSPVHSGSAGDSVHILLNHEDGSLDNLFSNHLQLFSQAPLSALIETEFFVTDEKTNGFCGLIVKYGGGVILELRYNGEKYEVEFYTGRKDFKVLV